MASAPSIGFVGFGEAGFHIAKGLREAGIERIGAYDIHTWTPGRGETIRARAAEAGAVLAESHAELAQSSEIILSAVTPDQAQNASSGAVSHIKTRHLYVDLNSVSPATKRFIESTIVSAGARFVEVAMMSPVPPHGHKVPMLAGGQAAPEFAGRMAPFGMRIEIASLEVGVASATKMFRSIVVKGMEALITECVMGAGQYGAVGRVLSSLEETYPGLDWKRLASYMIGRVVQHGERRAREMDQVAATLSESGIEPIMAQATARRMDSIGRLGLKEAPAGYGEFLDALAKMSASALR